MKNAADALHAFYSGFGIPAYPAESVPKDARRPYITYSVNVPEWNRPAAHWARVWYRATGNDALFEKADGIIAAIGQGVKLRCAGGYIALYPENPLAQLLVGEERTDRSVYLNLQLNAYTT